VLDANAESAARLLNAALMTEASWLHAGMAPVVSNQYPPSPRPLRSLRSPSLLCSLARLAWSASVDLLIDSATSPHRLEAVAWHTCRQLASARLALCRCLPTLGEPRSGQQQGRHAAPLATALAEQWPQPLY
jgi:hypothetical protein